MSEDRTSSRSSNAAVALAEAGWPRRRGVRAAMASLAPPDPSPRFWSNLERVLERQEQLDIVTRPAVRSINEPPPISQPTLDDDPRHGLAAYRPSGARRPEPSERSPVDEDEARRRRLVVVGIVVAVLVVLGAASVLGGGDEQPPPASSTSTTAAEAAAPANSAPATTAPPVPGLEPTTPLTAEGLGPLQAGMPLGQLHDAGVVTVVDQPTFDASGGTCFDARVPGAPDLALRFRSPDPAVGVTDPRRAQLVAIRIEAALGSTRLTDTGVGLGATEEQVRAAHAGNLSVSDRPDLPGGHIYLARAGSGLGIAYVTDGFHVTEIGIGDAAVIQLRQACA